MRALVRRPSPRLADGLVSHIERSPAVDAELAVRQWGAYVAVLAEHGFTPVEVPPVDGCPDGVFVEDTMVVFRDLAVIGRPGAAERVGEIESARAAVAAAGCRVAEITAPGTIDGGDVLKVGDTVYVGRSARTNAEGARQLAAQLIPLGATVVEVPVTKVLHLKSAVTALPDGTVIGYRPLVDDPDLYPRFREVPEAAGAHVVLLGGDTVLMAAGAPRTAELLSSLGWSPVQVDISEFEKLEGCVTCLSVRLRESL